MNGFGNKPRAWAMLLILVISLFGIIGSGSGIQSSSSVPEVSMEPMNRLPDAAMEGRIIQNSDLAEISSPVILEEFNIDFEFDIVKETRWSQEWELVRIEGCFYTFVPWEPRVPVKTIVFDTGYDVSGIEVTYSEPTELDDLLLPPAPEPEVLIAPDLGNSRVGNANEDYISGKIDSYKSIAEYYPQYDLTLTKLDRITVGNEVRNIYTIHLYPCKYNPALRSGILFQKAHVQVYYDPVSVPQEPEGPEFCGVTVTRGGGSESTGSARDAAADENWNEDNYEEEYEVKYLILTTAPLVDKLEPLAAWKLRKGLTTKIVDVNSIYENETFDGYDEPDELRNYIRWSYNELGTEYVLLAGDYDAVPPRMCHDPNPYAGADDGEIPSDSYYACISEGTTWDVDGDHIYGELGDLDDIYPDIIVGRIAINQEVKMSEWVDEVINYECNPGIENWTDKVILIGPNVHNRGDGAEQSEYFYDKYLKFIYGTFDKFYEDSENGNKPFSKSEIIKSINTGATFLNYLGHGGPTSWTYNYGYSGLLNKGDVNKFKNSHMKPVVYAMSCLTQWFDDPSDSGYGNFGDCIGETFTENVGNAGIGYIGSARTSVGSIGYGYGPFATGLQEDFIRQLSQYNFGLGSAFTDGKKHYSESFGNRFPDESSNGEVQACWLEVNLLGEPELPLWTEKPQTFNVTNVSDENTLIITIQNQTGSPVKNAVVCLQEYATNTTSALLDVKITSTTGEVVFYTAGIPQRLNLTITKTNFIPYLERVTISDMVPPVTLSEIKPQMPDGENDWYLTVPTINLSINEDGVTYYRWDNDSDDETYEIYVEPIIAFEGEHVLNFYSVDLSNNFEQGQNVLFKVDLTPPVCEVSMAPETPNGRNGWYTLQPMINITVTGEVGAVIYYAFDDDLNLTFTDPIQAPVGIHELHYYSKDLASIKGEDLTMTLKVDITPPKTGLICSPAEPSGSNGWYNDNAQPSISFTTEDGADTYYYWSGDANNRTYQYQNTKPITCPEGENTLFYYSVDFAGCQEKIKSYSIKLDTVPPQTQHTLAPEFPDGENGYFVSGVSIDLETEQDGTIFYFWDDSPSQVYYDPIKGIEGVHTLTYYSTDIAGNTGEQIKIEIKLDTIRPITTVHLEPKTPTGDNDWYDVIPTLRFGTEPELDAEAKMEVYYHFGDHTDLDVVVPEQFEVLEGITKIYYHSVDVAGNIGEEEMITLKVDITPPRAQLDIDMLTYNKGSIVTFTVTGSHDNNNIAEYYMNYGDGKESGWVTTDIFKHKYDKPGQYEVTLLVHDEAGLENDREETLNILIVEEIKEPEGFLTDNLILVITFIIGVFIVLSALFIFVHKRYNETTRVQTQVRGQISEEYDNDRVELSLDVDVGDNGSVHDDLLEAIILDDPVVFKMNKIKCPGCSSLFLDDSSSGLESGSGVLTCPHCGLSGKIPKTKAEHSKSMTKKKTKTENFKCPECKCIFKTSAVNRLIQCPSCGIKGQL